MAGSQNSILFFFVCPINIVQKQVKLKKKKNYKSKNQVLNLIWMDILDVHFMIGRGM